MTAKTPALLCAVFALGSHAFAQNDECSTAMPVAPGVYAFDTTTATLSPEVWPCASGGGPDLWYAVTATGDSSFIVETCGGAAWDTALEVFTGTCGNLTSVLCNDDACGVQSRIAFALQQGNTAYVRVGGFGGATGTGTLTITETIIPPPAGSAASWLSAVNAGTPPVYSNSLLPGPILDDIGFPNGNTAVTYEFVVYGSNDGTSSALMGNLGSGVGTSAALKFEQWSDTMQYGVTAYGVADYTFGGGLNTEAQDIHLVYVANVLTNTTELFVDGVSFGTVPSAPVLQGMQGIGQAYRPSGAHIDVMGLGRIRGVAVYDAALTLGEIIAHRDAYFSGSLGTIYCSPAVPNSTGASAAMSANGSTVAANNMLTLECTDMPLNSFGFFLTSRTQGAIQQPGNSQGVLCVSGSIGRYVGPGQVQNSGAGGAIALALNLTQHPTPQGFVAVLAGDTWNFTAWYRDVVGGTVTSNFANGLSILFQ